MRASSQYTYTCRSNAHWHVIPRPQKGMPFPDRRRACPSPTADGHVIPSGAQRREESKVPGQSGRWRNDPRFLAALGMTLTAVRNDIRGCSVRFGVDACCVRFGVDACCVRFGMGACCVRRGVGACSVRRGMAVRSLSLVIPSPARNLAPAQRAARLARHLRFLSALRSVRNDIRYTLRATSHPPSPRLLQHRNDINRRPA